MAGKKTKSSSTSSAATTSKPASQNHLAIRRLTDEIPKSLLKTLVTHHNNAYDPKEPTVGELTPTHIRIDYLQPYREVYYNPFPTSHTLQFEPPLEPLPQGKEGDNGFDELCWTWEHACSERLKEMEKVAAEGIVLKDRADIQVTRFVWPSDWNSWRALSFFLILTGIIVIWIVGGEDTPFVGPLLANYVFTTRKRLDYAVMAHTIIILKKANDVLKMREDLRNYRVDLLPEGRFRGPWLTWLIACALEGPKARERLAKEAERLRAEKRLPSKKTN
ncbi:hypothetical protein BJ508DRAFT_412160 [Ascobolus immersus RN42]|uniref:Uncharacterized protein n=1 Tax=Ascobolus immersus RN42 TaxID=1160509 RepID=A0A3N4IL02_ASCIM|nr:hypothetical protein BJ508DRAFT_412160 [Ascobolus immersus RN42]